MLDIGFWELLIIAIVLLLVMGPERLPEVAKQAAYVVRKVRDNLSRFRNEMQNEMGGTPFDDLQEAKREVSDLKNELKQIGKDFVDSAEQKNHHDDVPKANEKNS